MLKNIIVFVLVILSFNICVYASASATPEIENNAETAVQAMDTVENILNEFENNSEELQEKVNEVIGKNADNFFVKIFKSIIDVITKFLDAILQSASEAIKVR